MVSRIDLLRLRLPVDLLPVIEELQEVTGFSQTGELVAMIFQLYLLENRLTFPISQGRIESPPSRGRHLSAVEDNTEPYLPPATEPPRNRPEKRVEKRAEPEKRSLRSFLSSLVQ